MTTDKLAFVFSAMVFAAIFLVAIIVYGEHGARSAAIAASLFGCMSQFVGQDANSHVRIYRASIYLAYFAFVLSIAAVLMFVRGI